MPVKHCTKKDLYKKNSTLFNVRLGLRLLRSSETRWLAQQSHGVLYRSCLISSKNGTINLFFFSMQSTSWELPLSFTDEVEPNHFTLYSWKHCSWRILFFKLKIFLRVSQEVRSVTRPFVWDEQWIEGFASLEMLPFWRVDLTEEYLSWVDT